MGNIQETEIGNSRAGFNHGEHNDVGSFRIFCPYHPSPRNFNTGRLSTQSVMELLAEIRTYFPERNQEEQ
ncbi:MAG: hypothetical protein M1151_07100 [Candidatus Thermoplasmatota archaeon]|jgi:uracil-DNA glycosylase|nr:hypothetical protein [Candidatus Thermoplasmatota archaeon]